MSIVVAVITATLSVSGSYAVMGERVSRNATDLKGLQPYVLTVQANQERSVENKEDIKEILKGVSKLTVETTLQNERLKFQNKQLQNIVEELRDRERRERGVPN